MNAMVKFDFHGDQLDVVRADDGEHYAVLAPLCEPLELQAHPQAEKLKSAPWATTRIIRVVAEDGKLREVFCLSLRSIPMWLATINAGKVKPEVREKLALYQRECADVPADHFLGKRGAEPPPAFDVRQFSEAMGSALATRPRRNDAHASPEAADRA